MTSRERVINAINHRPVDRVPIDLGMHLATGVSAFAYKRLRDFLGLADKSIEMASLRWCLARVDDDVLERFHCDCVLLPPPWPERRLWRYDDIYAFELPAALQTVKEPDGAWRFYDGDNYLHMRPGSYELNDGRGWSPYFGTRGFGIEGCKEDLVNHAEKIYKDSDYATMVFGSGGCVGTDEHSLYQMAEDPEGYRGQVELQCERDIEFAAGVIESLGKYVQGYCIAADLGTQHGPIINPEWYQDLVAPSIKKLCDFIHNNSDMKVFNHCCGSIEPFIPIFIDCGVDILNPVQISADKMSPKLLKDKYGDKIVFWGGGCDTQNVLGTGTPEQVRENVAELVGILKQGSGFVFNQVQDIMGDVPAENITVMLDAAYEYGFYDEGDKA